MTNVAILAESRDQFGKGVARKLRAAGRVPAVIYGHESQVRHVSLPAHDLDLALVKAMVVLDVNIDGTVVTVAPRQIQRDPVRRIIEHLDLVLLSEAEQKERAAEARLIELAEEAAVEAGLDPLAVAEAAQALVHEGVRPAAAVDQAIEEVKAAILAQAEAAAAAADAEDAAADAVAEAAGDAADAAAAPSGDEG